MKKIILVILSVLCLASYGQLEKKSEKKNDLTEENLKGKVKSIKENTYEAVEKFGQIEKGDALYDDDAFPFTIYNEKGNKIEENHYYSDGSLLDKYTYKYDENGNKIEVNNYYSDGRLILKITYKYDENGNNIEECYHYEDGILSEKHTYKYDENGNIIERNDYNFSSSLDKKYTYKYDEKGNIIEINNYNSDGRLDSKYTYKYKYDKNNNWIQQVEYKNNKPIQIRERIIEYYP